MQKLNLVSQLLIIMCLKEMNKVDVWDHGTNYGDFQDVLVVNTIKTVTDLFSEELNLVYNILMEG